MVSRANPPSPNLSARGRRQQYPSLVSQKIPSQPGSARGPSNRVRFLLTSGGLNPSQAGSSQPSRGKIDQPLSSPGPRWAPPPGQSRCGTGAGEGWSGGKDLEWVTQGGEGLRIQKLVLSSSALGTAESAGSRRSAAVSQSAPSSAREGGAARARAQAGVARLRGRVGRDRGLARSPGTTAPEVPRAEVRR